MDKKKGLLYFFFLFFTTIGINHSAAQTPDTIPMPMIDSLLQGLFPLADTVISQDSLPEKRDSTATKTGRKTTLKNILLPPVDSSKISYFYAMNPEREFSYPDTALHGIEIFDPARQSDIPYATLGNLGSAHYQKIYAPTFQTGFDPGYHQYDLYKIDPEKIRYFKLHKMFTNFYYTQGRKQTDGYFKGIFSRNFSDGFRLNFEMKRISQTGDYSEQLKSNTAISTGVWYQSKNKRYDAFWSMTNNAIKSYDNGGIQSDTLFGQRYYGNTLNVPVILEGARTVQVSQNYAWLQHYTIGGQTDTTGHTKRNFRLSYHLRYNPNLYKSFDVVSETEDSLYHKFNVHELGVRNYSKVKTLENSFFISTGKSKESKGLLSQKDKLEIGLRHFYHNIYLEPQDTNVNNLLLNGRLNFEPIPAIILRTYAQLGLWAGAGEYRIQGELELSPGNFGNLQVQFLNQRKAPELIQQKLYISGDSIWNNNFKKIFETSLTAKYTLKKFRLELSGGYHLLDNYIYFDTLATPIQNNSVINIFQLSLKKDFILGILNFNNKITLQQDNSLAIELPDFVSDHSLYIQTRVFRKAMLLQTGLNLHLTDNYRPYAYMPLTGQFHLQQARTRRPYFWFAETDFFLNFQISSFRGFIKVANISDFFYSKKYYPTYNHPMFDWRIRWGFSWRFLD